MASLTNVDVLVIAEEIIGSRCDATIHKGDGHAVAVRLSGDALSELERVGVDLAAQLPGDLRSSGDFVAVWFDRRNVAARLFRDRTGASGPEPEDLEELAWERQ